MPIDTVETPEARVDLKLREDVAQSAKGVQSWAEVARRAGLQATSISQLLSGKVRLSEVKLGTVARLCVVLGLEVGELVRIDAEPKIPRVQTARPITTGEFAAAVREILKATPPADWIGPTEEDLVEVSPAQFAAKLRRSRGAAGSRNG